MSGLLVKRLLWRVSSTLTDTKPQYTRYPERDMVVAIQMGVKALCKYLPHVGVRTVSMRLATGSRQSIAKIPAAKVKTYDGSPAFDVFGMQLQEVIRNMGEDGLTPGRAIHITDRKRLDRLDPAWHTKSGAVVRQAFYSPQDPLTFWVDPPVQNLVPVWVDVTLVCTPPPIPDGGNPGEELYGADGDSDQLVGVDDQYEEELWNYAVAYLLLSNAKTQAALTRASLHASAFNSSINAIAAALTGQNPNLKRLPFAPDIPGAAS